MYAPIGANFSWIEATGAVSAERPAFGRGTRSSVCGCSAGVVVHVFALV